MYVLKKLLTFIGLLALATFAMAQEGQKKLLVIAADHSSSMNNGIPQHITIQTTAFRAFFAGNPVDCGDVTVVYFAWSDRIWDESMYIADLANLEQRAALVSGIEWLGGQVVKSGTDHWRAYRQARLLFEAYPDYEHYLLVTTDEAGSTEDLGESIPEAKVFAIAYTNSSATYAEKELVTETWNVSFANDQAETISAITNVLREVAWSVCTGL